MLHVGVADNVIVAVDHHGTMSGDKPIGSVLINVATLLNGGVAECVC